jgi:hypothetical protein
MERKTEEVIMKIQRKRLNWLCMQGKLKIRAYYQ